MSFGRPIRDRSIRDRIRSLWPRSGSRCPRVGVALGGGLPFGVVAAGVLDVFEAASVPIDFLAGTSMGAIVGALYAAGLTPLEIEAAFTEHFRRSKLLPMLLHDLRLSPYGFFDGGHLMKHIGKLIGEDRRFEDDLKVRFAIPAADLITGEEVVFDSGPVLPAVRASISMPAIFQPLHHQGRYLVDGAIVSPIPIDVVRRMGATFVIAVRAVRSRLAATGPVSITADRSAMVHDGEEEHGQLGPDPGHPSHPPDVIHTLWRAMSVIEQDRFADLQSNDADLRVQPVLPTDLAGDTDRMHELIAIGREEARRCLPEIARRLGRRVKVKIPPRA